MTDANAQYAVGIDLGTTNSVISFVKLDEDAPAAQVLPVPQLVDRATVEARPALPSFTYLATDAEAQAGACDLPWVAGADYAVGEFARRQSADNPDRTVGAAKSWLCHGKVDRHARILPWQAPEELPKISPVDASQRYLEHLVEAWDAEFPDSPIAQQHVVLTVPASFDPAARELTREAALKAGLPDDLVLLEEPQAAVYAWLQQMGDGWRKTLEAGETLLVVDVGGGTTDLTLVDVVDEDGDLNLRRKAVGDHLLVGGDNMDLALAYKASQLFEKQGVTLDPWQSVSLWHSCRAAKEKLLAEDGPETHTVSVLGRGSKLVGGTISVELTRDIASKLLTDGFFPKCKPDEKPQRAMLTGFQEIGLPYEADTGVTRHIAAFLARHGDDDGAVRPTHVLLNGGVFRADVLREQLMKVLGSWFKPSERPALLAGSHDLENAVSLGASFYGWTRANGALRIRGGTARSWYVGIETAGLAIPGAPRPLRALCVVAQGMEEGTAVDVPSSEIGLIVGEPAKFRFFGSTVRPEDQPGTLLPSWSDDELVETVNLEMELPKDDDTDETWVPVNFHSKVTELGVLELWCVHKQSDRRWKLEFDVREKDDGA
ncbi:MAG: Hsp70 family protein [Planctomycetaceae bacterium]